MQFRFDKLAFAVSVLTIAVFASGCAGTAAPNWLSPGPTRYQQMKAREIDPYPEVETGPEIVGGRPRDYTEPRSEPVRAQSKLRTWWGRLSF
jgi:hypothetical protein